MEIDQTIYSVRELIFAGFLLIGIGIMRFLGFIMPRTYDIFFNHFKRCFTKDLEEKIELLSRNLENYRSEKHMLQNDNSYLRRAILDKDEEVLKAIRDFYEKE